MSDINQSSKLLGRYKGYILPYSKYIKLDLYQELRNKKIDNIKGVSENMKNEKIKNIISKKADEKIEYIKKNNLEFKKEIENILDLKQSTFKQYIGTVIDRDKPLKNRYNNLDKVTELKTKTDYKVKYTVIPVRLVCLLIKIDLSRNNFNFVIFFTIFNLN
jgi:hypothetical protein